MASALAFNIESNFGQYPNTFLPRNPWQLTHLIPYLAVCLKNVLLIPLPLKLLVALFLHGNEKRLKPFFWYR